MQYFLDRVVIGIVAAVTLTACTIGTSSTPRSVGSSATPARRSTTNAATPTTVLLHGVGPYSSWRLVPRPDQGELPGHPDVVTDISGVSCPSARFCEAVGNTSQGKTLIEAWNGRSWSVVTSPSTDGSTHDDLTGVSCSTTRWCVAAGYFHAGLSVKTLVESWNGRSWSIMHSASLTDDPTRTSYLAGVSCVSAHWCMAVGADMAGKSALSEVWNGRTWSIVPLPDEGTFANELNSISCISPLYCLAVGDHENVPFTQRPMRTMVEAWNGQSWTIVPSPSEGTIESTLEAVSCISPRTCIATGYFVNSSRAETRKTLAEAWNGTYWSVTPTPDVGAADNILSGVSCISPHLCIAVGFRSASSSKQQILVQEWNGSLWSTLLSSNEQADGGLLNSVSCPSREFCVAMDADGPTVMGAVSPRT